MGVLGLQCVWVEERMSAPLRYEHAISWIGDAPTGPRSKVWNMPCLDVHS
ncbi:predicted protein [Plenodomus lingam JN3]|uniref:Predicted protein n=1 Tax=Leptosphaeria maculans (strain JN3 / isolate v23.1.3 / race Av1-4-5-6-7-8) TaxID=985895 RepID=E4ZVU0_LEPMJ|nr:predicted protein [Plenodomus lingam JN3]CBX95716.1 predicted protein [Plenodomus lingam JN3]